MNSMIVDVSLRKTSTANVQKQDVAARNASMPSRFSPPAHMALDLVEVR